MHFRSIAAKDGAACDKLSFAGALREADRVLNLRPSWQLPSPVGPTPPFA